VFIKTYSEFWAGVQKPFKTEKVVFRKYSKVIICRKIYGIGDHCAERDKPSSKGQISYVLYSHSFVETKPKMMMMKKIMMLMIMGHECIWSTV
jgi:hypothetical protein